MRRRDFIKAATASAVAWPLVARAQQPAKPVLGFVNVASAKNFARPLSAFLEGLSEPGYVDGRNVVIEYRWAEGANDQLPSLVADLIQRKVSVIAATSTPAAIVAKAATTTIPIVDPVMGDPVAFGAASTLARPGRNVTGSVQFSPEAGAKRLEFLKQAFPRVTRVAVLINPANAGSSLQLHTMRATAAALKLDLEAKEVRSAAELAPTFSKIAQGRFDAIVVPTDSLFRASVDDIARRVAMQKLPSIGSREFAVAGGLMGYGPNANELYRHAAYFVDRILRGAKPGELPIERATKLDLVVNLRAASAAGITVPESMLVRATEVIR